MTPPTEFWADLKALLFSKRKTQTNISVCRDQFAETEQTFLDGSKGTALSGMSSIEIHFHLEHNPSLFIVYCDIPDLLRPE